MCHFCPTRGCTTFGHLWTSPCMHARLCSGGRRRPSLLLHVIPLLNDATAYPDSARRPRDYGDYNNLPLPHARAGVCTHARAHAKAESKFNLAWRQPWLNCAVVPSRASRWRCWRSEWRRITSDIAWPEILVQTHAPIVTMIAFLGVTESCWTIRTTRGVTRLI